MFAAVDSGGTADPTPARAAITVTGVNDAPEITFNGGLDANLNVPENTTAVGRITATDPDLTHTLTFSLDTNGGEDHEFFTIDSNSGC